MSSQGPLFGSTISQSSTGQTAWGSLSNMLADDGASAGIGGVGSGATTTSEIASLTGFGFSIPATATINGIQVDVKKQGLGGTVSQCKTVDKTVQLIIGGTATGANKANVAGGWPTSALTYVSYGNASDLWTLTPTPAQINASNFGVAFQCDNFSIDNIHAPASNVDAIRITVTYTVPAPTLSSCTPSSGGPGTNITNLAGTNFYGTPTVTIGGVACTSVTVVSSTQITCTVGNSTPGGAQNVVVTNPDGQSATLTNGFTLQVNASTTASSLSSATSVGAVTGSASAGITGVSSTTSVGTVFTPEAVVGVSSTTSVGQVGGSVITPVTGLSSATSVGTVTVAVSPNIVGQSSTTSVGAPTYTGTATFALTGVRTTSSQGVAAATGISQSILGYFQAG